MLSLNIPIETADVVESRLEGYISAKETKC